MAFSPDYVRLVLRENFEDAKRLFLEPLLDIHAAHLVMLAGCRIIGPADARRLRDALRAIDPARVREAPYIGDDEDLFFYLDRLLAEACGADVAGRLHTARSRNDIDMTLYRMRLRGEVLGLLDAAIALRRVLVDLASRHIRTVFAAHTHAQPAQPTTVAHYLLGVVEPLERDALRLQAAYRSVNICPLGACAITGTGFAIDRARTAALLGFSGPSGNTYGSIATVDYLLESAAAAAGLVVGVGRFMQDLVLWSMPELGYVRLPDAFVQRSSIMPQKRNPVALEHARSLASRAFAELQAIPTVAHNTPYGDIVDTEDDLQPLVAQAFRDAQRAVALAAAACGALEIDEARMRQAAASAAVTVTELADTLVRDAGLPFGTAHALVSDAVRRAGPSGQLTAAVVAEAARAQGRTISLSAREIERALSPMYFVEVRRTPGGPAPEVVEAALEAARTALAGDEGWRRDAAAAQAAAAGLLARALASL